MKANKGRGHANRNINSLRSNFSFLREPECSSTRLSPRTQGDDTAGGPQPAGYTEGSAGPACSGERLMCRVHEPCKSKMATPPGISARSGEYTLPLACAFQPCTWNVTFHSESCYKAFVSTRKEIGPKATNGFTPPHVLLKCIVRTNSLKVPHGKVQEGSDATNVYQDGNARFPASAALKQALNEVE